MFGMLHVNHSIKRNFMEVFVWHVQPLQSEIPIHKESLSDLSRLLMLFQSKVNRIEVLVNVLIIFVFFNPLLTIFRDMDPFPCRIRGKDNEYQ